MIECTHKTYILSYVIIHVSIHIGDNYQVEFELLTSPSSLIFHCYWYWEGGASQGIIMTCSTEGYMLLRVLHLYVYTFEDDFPFPKVGYVSSLEGIKIYLAL